LQLIFRKAQFTPLLGIGTIDYELIATSVHMCKLEREEHLLTVFAYFDKDDSCNDITLTN
jgi:hypothetical protein